MSARAYYNEIDPLAASTLRKLIEFNLIAPGDVDERSIEDVLPNELSGYTQCHFFAGYGIWSYALRQAGWDDSRPVWTGSCPCQPFSSAGKGNGFADERHLWPAFFHLIQHGKEPDVPIYGEQVASKDGLAWLSLVWSDLEAAGLTVWPFDLCSAGFGAPNIRQRLFWMAYSGIKKSRRLSDSERQKVFATWGNCEALWMDNSPNSRCNYAGEYGSGLPLQTARSEQRSVASGMGLPSSERLQRRREQHTEENGSIEVPMSDHSTYPTNGFWQDADWLFCKDGRFRPVEPGTFPLANGYPNRVGILRGAGNAINAEVAKAFIEVTMEFL